MARAASKPKKEISMEEALWKSADKLRGSVEPAEYKHVVLSLFFLKFASDKFEAQRKAIVMRKSETSCFGLKNSKMKMASYQPEKTQCTPWIRKQPLCH